MRRRKSRRSRRLRQLRLLGALSASALLVFVIWTVVVQFAKQAHQDQDLNALAARATGGDAEAAMELGFIYVGHAKPSTSDLVEGFNWLEKAAAQGMPEAQEAVGSMLLNGTGVSADPRAAMGWYEKAAAQVRPEAEGALGKFYHDGISVPQDFTLALEWFRKAAAQGHGESEYNLGIMYAEGQGTERNYLVAGQWFRDAAQDGYGTGVPLKYQASVKWIEEVERYRGDAEAGDAEAEYRLATLLYRPGAQVRNVPSDRERAMALFMSAAAKGHPMAMYILGTIYQGKGPRDEIADVDYVLAHMWYNLAASRLAPGPERDQAVKNRDFLAQYRLSPEQLAKAQQLAQQWRPIPGNSAQWSPVKNSESRLGSGGGAQRK
jgi:uncharacterized protein